MIYMRMFICLDFFQVSEPELTVGRLMDLGKLAIFRWSTTSGELEYNVVVDRWVQFSEPDWLFEQPRIANKSTVRAHGAHDAHGD